MLFDLIELDKVSVQAKSIEDRKHIRQFENFKGVDSSGQQEKEKTQDKGKEKQQENKTTISIKYSNNSSCYDKNGYITDNYWELYS